MFASSLPQGFPAFLLINTYKVTSTDDIVFAIFVAYSAGVNNDNPIELAPIAKWMALVWPVPKGLFPWNSSIILPSGLI